MLHVKSLWLCLVLLALCQFAGADDKKPLLTTSWHQYDHFSDGVNDTDIKKELKLDENKTYVAGCVPIALAQIIIDPAT
jgi:hypothetical protein